MLLGGLLLSTAAFNANFATETRAMETESDWQLEKPGREKSIWRIANSKKDDCRGSKTEELETDWPAKSKWEKSDFREEDSSSEIYWDSELLDSEEDSSSEVYWDSELLDSEESKNTEIYWCSEQEDAEESSSSGIYLDSNLWDSEKDSSSEIYLGSEQEESEEDSSSEIYLGLEEDSEEGSSAGLYLDVETDLPVEPELEEPEQEEESQILENYLNNFVYYSWNFIKHLFSSC